MKSCPPASHLAFHSLYWRKMRINDKVRAITIWRKLIAEPYVIEPTFRSGNGSDTLLVIGILQGNTSISGSRSWNDWNFTHTVRIEPESPKVCQSLENCGFWYLFFRHGHFAQILDIISDCSYQTMFRWIAIGLRAKYRVLGCLPRDRRTSEEAISRLKLRWDRALNEFP